MPTHSSNDTVTSGLNIYLQSKDGKTSNNNSNCDFFLDTIIAPERADLAMMISVIDAEIPYSFYNVTNENNKITIEDVLLTLPIKNYNAYDLTDTLNDLIASDITGKLDDIIVSFDPDTNKFKFQSSNSFTINSSTMMKELGFTSLSRSGFIIHSDIVCNLAGTSSIYIRSSNMNILNINSFGKNNGVISKVLVTSSPGNFIFYQPNAPQYFVLNTPLTYINIQMLDDDNEFIDFNGLNWSVTLSIDFFRKRDDTINYKYFLDGIPKPYEKLKE